MRAAFLLAVATCLSHADASFAQAPSEGERPESLNRAIASRARHRLFTARLEYCVRQRDVPPGMSEAARLHFYTWKCAGEDYITIDQGDAEGVVFRGLDGEPAPLTFAGPSHYLLQNGELWQHTESDISAKVFPGEDNQFSVIDLRNAGLNPSKTGGDLSELEQRVVQFGYPPLQYTETVQDGLRIVTAANTEGSFRWWIDPEKDWGIVRTETYLHQRKIGEERYTLEQIDDIWFPVRAEHYRLAAGDVEPSTVTEVLSAEFNRPEHPIVFTPADIGIEPGMAINYLGFENPLTLYWDGEKTVTFDEFKERKKRGEIEEGPTLKREVARLRAAGEQRVNPTRFGESAPKSAPTTTRPADPWRMHESEWEAYTREFIAHYALGKDQASRARTILKDCQQRAASRLARLRPKIRAHEDRVAALRAAGKALSTEVAANLEAHAQRLRAPFDEIFEKQLKPRLDSLPTRKQRTQAGAFEPARRTGKATTQPIHQPRTAPKHAPPSNSPTGTKQK